MLTCRWLGVAGLEFRLGDYTLLIDPFFTRPSKRAVLAGARVRSNAALGEKYAPRADAVLVTHPHYDHLLDVPEILKRTGARAFGSPNTRQILALHGIPGEKITTIQAGDRFSLGPFGVEVFPAHHTRIPLARWLNGPLPARLRALPQAGPVPHRGRQPRLLWNPRLPLSLYAYRMDACYSFRIRVDGRTLLVGNYPIPAEALFIAPYHPGNLLETTLRRVAPRVVVPIHWDDFHRPLSQPVLPMLVTPAQGLRPRFPPVRRIDLEAFTRMARAALPGVEVRIPAIFEPFSLE